MSGLKPCPFCGGEAHVKEVVSACEMLYTVGCSDSECMGHETWLLKPTKEEAIAAWNRRAERTCRNVCEWNIDTFHFTCSECGAEIGGDDWGDSPVFVGDYHEQLSYCPNCGAKVVGCYDA